MNLIFNNAQSVRELSAGNYKTEASFQALIVAALATAIASGQVFSTTVSTSGVPAIDVQKAGDIFGNNGFAVSQSGTTLTISW